jgi:riboflavin synthase
MFTGLVQEIGEIRAVEPRAGAARSGGNGSDLRLRVGFRSIDRSRLELGASISVDGVCLTVAELAADSFVADVSGETLRVTTLGGKQAGARVNLEPSLRAGDSLGGHWVSVTSTGSPRCSPRNMIHAACRSRWVRPRGWRATSRARAR